MKAFYLATNRITQKWTAPVRDWGQIIEELKIMDDYKDN